MSIHFGGVIMAAGAGVGLVLASSLGLGQVGAGVFAVGGAVGITAVSMKASGGSLAWGFALDMALGRVRRCRNGFTRRKASASTSWRMAGGVVHYESGMDVEGETPEDVDDELTAQLKEHGWYDE